MDVLVEVFCDFFFPAWGIVKVSPDFPAEPICNHVSLLSKSGAATMAWRTNGSWACSLTNPAVPCTSPFPPVSSRFPWDAASATANAKSRCLVQWGSWSTHQRAVQWGSWSTHQCHLVLFSPKGLHSVQRPVLWMGEGERGVRAAAPWLQVSKGLWLHGPWSSGTGARQSWAKLFETWGF